MNHPICLTKNAFNSLLAHIVELEEGISEIIDLFFSEPSKESVEIKETLNNYLRWMDTTLKKVSVTDDAEDYFPYVVVGSEVTVEDSGSGDVFSYKLVSPLRNKVNSNEISLLSPMGKAMLLKKVNDSFIVNAPGGDFEYKVLTIKITPDNDDSNSESTGDASKSDFNKQHSNLVG